MSFFASKLSEEAKKIENFPKFQRYMEKTNTFKCKPPEVHFTIRNRVPYHKLPTNLACSSRTGNIGPRLFSYRPRCARSILPQTSGQYSPVRPSCSVSKRLVFHTVYKSTLSLSLPYFLKLKVDTLFVDCPT